MSGSTFDERARWARGHTIEHLRLTTHVDPDWYYKRGLGDPNSYEPLLPAGLSRLSLADLHRIAVAPFDSSKTRSVLWRHLELFHELVTALDVARELWVGGSFVTVKLSPRELDLVVVLDAERQRGEEPWERLMSPEAKGHLEAFGLDFACFVEDDWTFRKFHLGRLGFDRNDRARGIAVLSLPCRMPPATQAERERE